MAVGATACPTTPGFRSQPGCQRLLRRSAPTAARLGPSCRRRRVRCPPGRRSTVTAVTAPAQNRWPFRWSGGYRRSAATAPATCSSVTVFPGVGAEQSVGKPTLFPNRNQRCLAAFLGHAAKIPTPWHPRHSPQKASTFPGESILVGRRPNLVDSNLDKGAESVRPA